MRPDVPKVTRKDLAEHLLVECHERVVNQTNAVKATVKHIATTTDGSTDVNGASVTVCVTHFSDGTTVCEDVMHANQESHDAAWVAETINAQIALTLPGQRHCGACTDNTATNMLAMRDTLRPQHRDKFFHGCVCHVLQLAVGDVCRLVEGLSDTIDLAKEIIHFVYRHQKILAAARAAAKLAGKPFLVKPCATRWGVVNQSIHSLTNNEAWLRDLISLEYIAAGKNPEERGRRLHYRTSLRSYAFMSKLRQAETMLTPWCDLIVKFEGDKAEISDVYHEFEVLKETIADMPGIPAADLVTLEAIRLNR